MGLAKELTPTQKGGIIAAKKLGHNKDVIVQLLHDFLQLMSREKLPKDDQVDHASSIAKKGKD